MGKILQLDEKTANLIAAGEVVLGPNSVVKELVENSIDAKAKNISISLLNSGLKMIEVTDDGLGMDSDDVLKAFSRHATSKIRNAFDLSSIKTLGFRGEAIPSIASVSNFEIISKPKEADYGYHAILNGGVLKDHGVIAATSGTRIIVKNLFYNTPVRLKYLSDEQTLLSNIVGLVMRFCLANPYIGFTLTNDDRILIQTNGDGNFEAMFYDLYGKDIAKNMYHNQYEDDGVKIDCYFSSPVISKPKKNYITIVVNGRNISSNVLNNVISDTYLGYMPKYRYPIVLLNIEIDPLLVDINIHPSKMEIKFSLEDQIKALVNKTLDEGLKKLVKIPDVKVYEEERIEPLNFDQYIDIPDEKMEYQYQDIKKEAILNDVKKDEALAQIEEIKVSNQVFPYLEYIGQLSGTYLLFQNEEGLYLIDQHAAQERINYEFYFEKLKTPKNEYVEVLVPFTFKLIPEEYILLIAHKVELSKYGLYIEDMGNNTIFIRKYPNWLKGDINIALENIINHLASYREFDLGKVRDSLAKMIACKASVKANHYLTNEEVANLLQDLKKCKNPFNCPHGRPVFVKLTLKEIEKLFLRTL